jgi:hypothetical protein
MRSSESVLRWLEHEDVGVKAIWTATRIGFLAVLILLLSWCGAGAAAPGAGLQKLQVSANGRFLVKADGSPFFWLNDTAWFLPKVSNADVSSYLADRAEKRFTSVMIACVYHSDILYNGEGPFLNENTDTPNATFWEHMDFILSEAEHYGLYVAITVMWAEDYQALIGNDLEKASRLGHWLGTRYRDRNNVLWVVSGEYNDAFGWTTSLYEAVAQGLMDGHQGNHLMTIHPSADQSSAKDFHESSWLSFNMLQSGHQSDNEPVGRPENYEVITHDYQLSPVKPAVDGEPAYEDFIDTLFDNGTDEPRIEADTVRRKAYWAVFAGALGHTYGNENIEIMYIPGDDDYGFPHRYWKDALNDPGATQMRHVRTLMEARSFLDRIPDQSVVVSNVGSGLDHVQATRAADGTYAMIYIPRGGSVDVNLAKISGQGVVASWFNPRDGSTTQIGLYSNSGTRTFDAPGGEANGNDWVLLLDSTHGTGVPPAITSPAVGTVLATDQMVTATGMGTDLDWSIDRIGDGLPAFARGIGSSITFTVPPDATSSQKIRILLTGNAGSDTRDYAISRPAGAPSNQ